MSAAEGAGIIKEGGWDDAAAFQKAWKAICGVWAAKWNDRAWLSRKAIGMKDANLKMAVLLQEVGLSPFADGLN